MIKPTIGRIVWYTPKVEDGLSKQLKDTPPEHGQMAAIVTAVHNDRKVNLAVFDTYGSHYGKTNVQLLQDDDKPSGGEAYCRWMPYQVGQAQAQQGGTPGATKPAGDKPTEATKPLDGKPLDTKTVKA